MDEGQAEAQKTARWPDFWPYGPRKPASGSSGEHFPDFRRTVRGGAENAP